MVAKRTARRKGRSPQRPLWKGFLRFSLVSIPVKAFAAYAKDREDIDLDWLHDKCHRRVQYRKVCPLHGELSNGEIVSGYKHGKAYVVIDPEELGKLRTQGSDIIDVTSTVAQDEIDPMYYTDKTYYLLPDGKAGERSYQVLEGALDSEHMLGVATVVLFRREHVVAIRALKGLMMMTVLSFPRRFRNVSDFTSQLPRDKPTGREAALARTLVGHLRDEHFDLTRHRDPYIENLHRLIDAKIHGHEIEAVPREEPPESLDFMAALKRSLAAAEKPRKKSRERKPRRRRAS